MKSTNTITHAKLGLFVIAGITFLVLTLYMIGKNKNILGDTFSIRARVAAVNGLVAGNNVRLKGIDVGTVKSIQLESDTSVIITMLIDKKYQTFIRKNAVVSIGTDGLMGNRLVNINAGSGAVDRAQPGDILYSLKPVETDEMLRTLNTTNNNIEKISTNLHEITLKINNSKSLWGLLADTVITADLKEAVRSFRDAGANTRRLTREADALIHDYRNGNGLAPALFTDTILVSQLKQSIDQLRNASEKTSATMTNVNRLIEQVKQGDGTAGMLLADTALRNSLRRSVINIETSSSKLDENMKAMRSHFLFRGYFRKLEKQEE